MVIGLAVGIPLVVICCRYTTSGHMTGSGIPLELIGLAEVYH